MKSSLLFEAIDAMDSIKFGTFLAPNCHFRMANFPAIEGGENAANFVKNFQSSIAGSKHWNVVEYKAQDQLFLEGKITYTLKNGKEITLDYLNRLKIDENDLAIEYIVYFDPSPLLKALEDEKNGQ
eukprot:TRINITY_DN2093_c0_g1_i1.p2 TRINITY_DN2093_c0_g1~~TRINITY_DN2093_c0_g1_i1.p2  ORF type:complete len:126 (-),score=41.40 TRINITY_DN2093_c0_g1_i1:146-523(-)